MSPFSSLHGPWVVKQVAWNCSEDCITTVSLWDALRMNNIQPPSFALYKSFHHLLSFNVYDYFLTGTRPYSGYLLPWNGSITRVLCSLRYQVLHELWSHGWSAVSPHCPYAELMNVQIGRINWQLSSHPGDPRRLFFKNSYVKCLKCPWK